MTMEPYLPPFGTSVGNSWLGPGLLHLIPLAWFGRLEASSSGPRTPILKPRYYINTYRPHLFFGLYLKFFRLASKQKPLVLTSCIHAGTEGRPDHAHSCGIQEVPRTVSPRWHCWPIVRVSIKRANVLHMYDHPMNNHIKHNTCLFRTWTVKAPDATLKQLAKDDVTCSIGVILRGQFYVYGCGEKQVAAINKATGQNFKVGMGNRQDSVQVGTYLRCARSMNDIYNFGLFRFSLSSTFSQPTGRSKERCHPELEQVWCWQELAVCPAVGWMGTRT